MRLDSWKLRKCTKSQRKYWEMPPRGYKRHPWAVQYDAAVDPGIAKTKIKGESQVAGRASVLIVPDLQVGNIVYKVTSSTV